MAATATELERLLVRLVGDNRSYLASLEQSERKTSEFVRDANGYFRDLQGRFVSAQAVIRSEVGLTIRKINAYGIELRRLADMGKTVGANLSSLGRKLTIGLTMPLAIVSGFALKTAMDFESSFAGVRKTVDATEGEFAQLKSGFRKMSLSTPIDVNELNKIGEAAGQLGIDTPNILGFTKVMADLGVTTNLSSEEAAMSLAQFANITKMNQKDFERLGSTIVGLGNNFATTERDIVAFGTRLAGAGSLVGFNEADIMGVSAAMSSLGIEAEAGGTAVQKMLLQIQTAVSTNSDQLKGFAQVAGMSAEQFKQAWEKDAAGAFDYFMRGLGSQGNDAIATLQELSVEDARSIRAFLALGGAGDILTRSLKMANQAFEENTALAKEAGERYKTAASQVRLAYNAFKDAALTLGDSLMPVFKSVLEVLKGFIEKLNELAIWFSLLDKSTQQLIITIFAVIAALGPILIIIGSVVSNVSVLIGMLGTLLMHFRLVVGAIGAITSAGGLLAAAIAAIGGATGVAIIGIVALGYAIYKILTYFDMFGLKAAKARMEMEKLKALREKEVKDAAEGAKAHLDSLSVSELHSRLEKINEMMEKVRSRQSKIIDNYYKNEEASKAAYIEEEKNLKFLRGEYAKYENQLAKVNKEKGTAAAAALASEVYIREEEATKKVREFTRKLEQEVGNFGMSGPQREVLEFQQNLEAAGDKLTATEEKRLQVLAKELEGLETKKKTQEEAQKAWEKANADNARDAVKYLDDMLTPIERLGREIKDVERLAKVGALTQAQASSIIKNKIGAYQESLGEVTRSGGGSGQVVGSKEAMIARRGSERADKNIEKGIWEMVDKMETQTVTEEQILATLQAAPKFNLVPTGFGKG